MGYIGVALHGAMGCVILCCAGVTAIYLCVFFPGRSFPDHGVALQIWGGPTERTLWSTLGNTLLWIMVNRRELPCYNALYTLPRSPSLIHLLPILFYAVLIFYPLDRGTLPSAHQMSPTCLIIRPTLHPVP